MKKRRNIKKNVRFQDSEFYFDDCAICNAMKEAENQGKNLSLKELKGAFKKAKEQKAIVGGSLIDNEN